MFEVEGSSKGSVEGMGHRMGGFVQLFYPGGLFCIKV